MWTCLLDISEIKYLIEQNCKNIKFLFTVDLIPGDYTEKKTHFSKLFR